MRNALNDLLENQTVSKETELIYRDYPRNFLTRKKKRFLRIRI